jgi:hypothetical protein
MTALELDLVRPILESEIERLIDLLDTIDEDTDLEPDADGEPWLGAPDARTGSWSGLYAEGHDDREEDDSDREPCCEDEGAQCDDEGSIEQDNGDAEDDFTSESYMSVAEEGRIGHGTGLEKSP